MQAANGAIAQVLSDMAGKYNQINMLDAQLAETDYQQEFDNWQTLGQNIAGDLQDKMNMGQKIDEMLISPYAEWIEANVENKGEKLKMQKMLYQISTNMFAQIYNQTGSMEYALSQTTQLIESMFLSMGYYVDPDDGPYVGLSPAGYEPGAPQEFDPNKVN